MKTTTPRPAAETPEQAAMKARLLAGALAEQRHQYLDLDTDSACLMSGASCPSCPPRKSGDAR